MNPGMQKPAVSNDRKPAILIVDDDPNNLAVIHDCLMVLGYTILVAENGEGALKRAAYARPDLILLDIMMPGMDGYETCRRLKSMHDTKDIPVIFMTALAETVHKVNGLESGAVDYITKPFKPAELRARIAVHLQISDLAHKLCEANESLEKRVQKRTAELELANHELKAEIIERKKAEEERLRLECELRHAQKMEAIGTLAAGIAHDFNNILTAIIGLTELALGKIPSGNPAHYDMERVLESGMRAADLVKQILTYSSHGEQERIHVLLNPIIVEVLDLLRASLPSTIEIRQVFEIDEKESLVLANPTQLQQVLMNLCTNAAHAMQAHGGILSVSLSAVVVDESLGSMYPDLNPGPYLKLTVSDTGHGIDASVMERIFDPYFTTKKPGDGTGLGLAVTMGIVQNHEGAITVHSEPGQGTVFQVFFPRAEGEIDLCIEEIDEPLARGNERILFVDDEKTLADIGREMLELLGYHVTVEHNGREALGRFSIQPDAFDLIITDMTMPDFTGMELTRRLLSIRPDIPVIMCSGFTEFIDKVDYLDAGINKVLKKPYLASNMAKTIRNVLEGSQR